MNIEPVKLHCAFQDCDLPTCSDITCDLMWIDKLSHSFSKELGINAGSYERSVMYSILRGTAIKVNNIAFCDFSPDRFQEYVFINHICVAREHQRKGIATAMLNYLCKTYNKDIKLNCFKHTQAETFWEHIGTRDNSKYNSRVNTYIVRKNDLRKSSFLRQCM